MKKNDRSMLEQIRKNLLKKGLRDIRGEKYREGNTTLYIITAPLKRGLNKKQRINNVAISSRWSNRIHVATYVPSTNKIFMFPQVFRFASKR